VVSTVGLGADDKDIVVPFNQSMKAICVEYDSPAKKDKSFLVGGANGQLIYHRTVWFTQKNVTLFNGADSAISNIAWRGNVVAWADATQVRLMNLSTQSAICFLDSPIGVGIESPLPCCLFWESEFDLMIGWGDSFRHIDLITTPLPGIGTGTIDGELITARNVVNWETDCIICGISSFDADHVLILGYAPPEEEELGNDLVIQNDSNETEKELLSISEPNPISHFGNNYDIGKNKKSFLNNPKNIQNVSEKKMPLKITLNQPEVQIISRLTGEVISSDILPLDNISMQGPRAYHLLSSYYSQTHERDANKWKLRYKSI
jgi:hypothetical protein